MSAKDSITKNYLQDSSRFADLFNFYLHNGKPVIRADQLKPIDTTTVTLPYGNDGKSSALQKHRDVIKIVGAMSDNYNAYLLLAVEIQSNLHYAMPVRNMLYDAMQYSQQVEETSKSHKTNKDKPTTSAEYLSGFYKTDKLLPVITLTVYLEADEWDAPKSLHDMLLIEDKNLLKFIPDYQLNLIAPAAISDEDFGKFHTELSPVLKYLKYSKNKQALNEIMHNDPAYRDI